ncbi:hypothetical protein ABMA28_001120 [Loxostege sticticalis]|uniref:Peptidase A2 domain-containing protein n=1 Tax=Loxostege sticticalis TaxID=481309 RepID=A0ABD0T7G0_LOXSC
MLARAILDTGSQASLVTDSLIKRLGLAPTPNNTNIIGVGNSKNCAKYSIPLEIQSTTSSYRKTINFHVVQQITCKLPQNEIDISKLKIPEGVVLADKDYYFPSSIDLLMGADIFFQILLPSQPEVELQSNNLVNTKLGYIIGGTILQQKAPDNKVTLFCSTCNNNINDEIKNFFEVEKVPQAYCEKLSEHDLAEDIFQKSVKLNNNKFQVDIPLKVPISEVNSHLGNSFDLALHRFLSLEKRLHKNPLLLTEYEKFIQEYVELGHSQYIDFQTYDLEQDPVYFLPHHAVVNEFSKTTRTRVVFDASMKTNLKVSLNDLMLNGSLPQKELFDIILLYRIGDFTFSTDIQKMFRNVLVNPEHASLQNILWRSHPSDTIQCIRLNTVTYGMKSSSFLATRCLLELTDRFGTDYPLASFILNNCTYIDDILYSTSDKLELLEAKAQLEAILQKGGFRTHKWASNSPDILSDIPYSEQQFNELELQKDSCTMKALGLHVDIKNDCFTMSSRLECRSPRCKILAYKCYETNKKNHSQMSCVF